MVTRGENPSCTACCVSEYAPLISACDAMMVAMVAMKIAGKSKEAGTSSKNGLFTSAPRSMRSAPCPK